MAHVRGTGDSGLRGQAMGPIHRDSERLMHLSHQHFHSSSLPLFASSRLLLFADVDSHRSCLSPWLQGRRTGPPAHGTKPRAQPTNQPTSPRPPLNIKVPPLCFRYRNQRRQPSFARRRRPLSTCRPVRATVCRPNTQSQKQKSFS